MKKRSLFLLPLLTISLASCEVTFNNQAQDQNDNQQGGGQEGGGEQGGGDTAERDAKFAALINNVKTNHNYTIHIHSQFDEVESEDEIMDYNYFNYNDKAFYTDNSYYTYSGYIYQKDQGYAFFDMVNSVIPDGFYSVAKDQGISELIELTAEHFFTVDYSKDDSGNYYTDNEYPIAVAANWSGYADYIKTQQLSVDSKINASINDAGTELSLSLDYWIMYYDEGEHKDKGNVTITIKDVGTTYNSVIANYIENPTTVYTAPTKWPSNMVSLFNTRFNKVSPVFINGLSYAAYFDEMLYEGYYYAGVQDLGSGDLRNSYGTQLVNDGYTQSSTNSNVYTKDVKDGVTGMSTTYTVRMFFEAATDVDPKGVFTVIYRANTAAGKFDNIAGYNAYMSLMGYDQIVPNLPDVPSCTGISNFKDQTAGNSEYYCLCINKTDWMKIAIPTYAEAKAFYDAYVSLLEAKGFVVETPNLWTTISYSSGSIDHGSLVSFQNIVETSYNGYVFMRIIIANEDADSLRAKASTLTGITLSGQTTQYSVGDTFKFTGTCTASFENGTSLVVTPTSVSTPDMSQAGTQTITVTYIAGGVTKTAEYVITITDVSLKSITLSGTYATSFKVGDTFSYTGLVVIAHYSDKDDAVVNPTSVSSPDMSTAGNKVVTVSYTEDGVTVNQTYNITVASSITKATLAASENTGYSVYFNNYNEDDITEFVYGSDEYFYVTIWPTTEFITVKSVTVEGDATAQVEFITDDMYDMGYGIWEYKVTPTSGLYQSTIKVNIELEEEVTPPTPTTYNVSKESGLEGGKIVIVSPSGGGDVEAGETVKFTVTADEGYEIDSFGVKDHPEITFGTETNILGKTSYTFTMPEHDCVLTATFAASIEPVATYNVSKESGLEGGKVVLISPSAAGEVEVGETVKFKVVADEGYEVESFGVKDHPEITFKTETGTLGTTVYTFTMPEHDCVITATFKSTAPAATYSVTKEINDANGGTVAFTSASSDLTEGDTVSFTAKAKDGYEIESVSIKNHSDITITNNGTNLAGATQYSFTMPAEDVVVVVNFKTTGSTQQKTIEDVLSETTFNGVCDDSSETNVTFVFNDDGTGSLTLACGIKGLVQSFKYSVTNNGSGSYSITLSNVTKVSGSVSGLSMNLNNFKSFGFTSDGKTISAATYVAYSSVYDATYTTTFSF